MDSLRSERDRLDAHFEWVLTLLRQQRLDGWSHTRRAARSATLARLAEYRRRGRFPRNTTRRDRMVPTFVDAYGTTCAVADLLLWSGRRALADEIRRTMNLSAVADMSAPELAAWADDAGLTSAEVELIQPDYGPDPEPDPCWTSGAAAVMQQDGTWCAYTPEGCVSGECKAGQCVEIAVCDDGDSTTDDVCKAQMSTGSGECTHTELPVEESGSCALGPKGESGPSTGSVAPLLAALFLLGVLARRSRRRIQSQPSKVLPQSGAGNVRSVAAR